MFQITLLKYIKCQHLCSVLYTIPYKQTNKYNKIHNYIWEVQVLQKSSDISDMMLKQKQTVMSYFSHLK